MPGVTWTESNAQGNSWTAGVPPTGATARHILFGAIILNQLNFEEPAASVHTEATVNAGTNTEQAVNSTSYTETVI